MTVVLDVKGLGLLGWLAAKEMCVFGCQSLVRSLRGKGRARRLLMWGIMSRALGTAREPSCRISVSYWKKGAIEGDVGGRERTGGQKSFWTSTTISAGMKGLSLSILKKYLGSERGCFWLGKGQGKIGYMR